MTFIVIGLLSLLQTRSQPIPVRQMEIPAELQRMQDYRAKLFDRARIEGSLESGGVTGSFSSQYAGEDFLLVSHGTETGLANIRMDGWQYAYSKRRLLFKDNQQWGYQSEHIILDLSGIAGNLPGWPLKTHGR